MPLPYFEFRFCPVNGSWQQYLTANSDRLSHFLRRMSLFPQTLVFRGILFSEQEHRQERGRENAADTFLFYDTGQRVHWK